MFMSWHQFGFSYWPIEPDPVRYRPVGPPYVVARGSLDYWLTERYCRYAINPRGLLCRGQIHHGPWPLQPAESEVEANTLAAANGIDLPEAPLVHFTDRQDVVAWYLERAAGPPVGTDRRLVTNCRSNGGGLLPLVADRTIGLPETRKVGGPRLREPGHGACKFVGSLYAGSDTEGQGRVGRATRRFQA